MPEENLYSPLLPGTLINYAAFLLRALCSGPPEAVVSPLCLLKNLISNALFLLMVFLLSLFAFLC